MTATTPTVPAAPPAASRVWRIVRLLTANPTTVVFWPLAILGIIFVMNWVIWWLIFLNLDAKQTDDAAAGIMFSGASTFIFVYTLVVAVQALNLSFPLALGYGATRRSFSLGSMLTFTLLSIFFATVMTIGAWLEVLTDGWGLRGSFFRTFYFMVDDNWLAQWWVFFCWFAFFSFVGMIFAAVFVRWKAFGLTTAFIVLGVVLLAVIAGITLTDSWAPFWEGIGSLGVLGVASVALIPALLSVPLSHLVLRRATPRS
jgi:hypothetical protein